MAIYMHSQKDLHFFYKVFWLILTVVCGAGSGFMRSGIGIEKALLKSSSNSINKFKRSAIEEPLQFPMYRNNSELFGVTRDTDLVKGTNFSSMYGNESSKEINKGYDLGEHSKSKASNKLKALESDHKNYNYNKVDMGIKHVDFNVSDNIESDTPLFQEHNLKSQIKNDNLSEFYLNLTKFPTPTGHTLENKKDKLSLSTSMHSKTTLEAAKPNNTHLISDTSLDKTINVSFNNSSTNVDNSTKHPSPNNTDTFNKNNDTIADGSTVDSLEDMDILVISGIGLGSVLIFALIVGVGFVVYRRQMWNKPQTLSDKCSNADSSGYIDDSTLRENSEEMYSLDNDSFLNSLEAMTIQNYWTDNVKHTKL